MLGKPEACVIKSWMVTGRDGAVGAQSEPPRAPQGFTFKPLNSGRYFSTGSINATRPSSTRIITPAQVTGLVIDMIRKKVVGAHRGLGLEILISNRLEARDAPMSDHQRYNAGGLARIHVLPHPHGDLGETRSIHAGRLWVGFVRPKVARSLHRQRAEKKKEQ